ncbi:prolyl-tRNA synthetase [Candidatus Saccharibacteria bacterium]|jgi:prolyl-tRNA synthetase|nr:prolyl-tRNA synthetase [Candidatus Saccharibacteria bacterium]MBP7834808.1 prolyl-tRNA synthetase [Candidatus Saccharibacteria bacterium]
MRATKLFTKSTKTTPADETSKNAQLLIKAGFINKEMAGVYAYLPLGLIVIEKIKQIIREEMNSINGNEIIMSSLQPKDVWQSTGRWDDEVVDVWFKSQLKNGTDVGFGWSHEEPITEMMKRFLSSYRDFPAYTYQFQTKMRNELRAKSGIMRGREFVMKDLYSYDIDESRHLAFYESVKEAYMRVFSRVGLGDTTYITFAAGGAFTKFSHEFQTVTEAGEDYIYLNKEKGIAINEEVLDDEVLKDLGVSRQDLIKTKSAEVGNIFNFGTSKCDDMKLFATNEKGESVSVFLGSYGIGVTRLMGVVTEHFSDEKGLVWPEEIAPFKVFLAQLGTDNNVVDEAKDLYEILTANGVEVFWDDRDVRPGEKFGDADIYGIPYRIVVSKKTLESGKYEVKKRTENESQMLGKQDLIKLLAS